MNKRYESESGDATPPPSQALADARRQLENLDIHLFSPPAFSLLLDRIESYIATLIIQSQEVAKWQRADTVSEAHVEKASDHLLDTPRRRFHRHLGTVGGILSGAGLPVALSHALGLPAITVMDTNLGFILVVLAIVAGTSLVVWHIAKD